MTARQHAGGRSMIRSRFSWIDVRAGWVEQQYPTATRGGRAPCGGPDYRLGWFLSWVIR